jgi:hypothetical protein
MKNHKRLFTGIVIALFISSASVWADEDVHFANDNDAAAFDKALSAVRPAPPSAAVVQKLKQTVKDEKERLANNQDPAHPGRPNPVTAADALSQNGAAPGGNAAGVLPPTTTTHPYRPTTPTTPPGTGTAAH